MGESSPHCCHPHQPSGVAMRQLSIFPLHRARYHRPPPPCPSFPSGAYPDRRMHRGDAESSARHGAQANSSNTFPCAPQHGRQRRRVGLQTRRRRGGVQNGLCHHHTVHGSPIEDCLLSGRPGGLAIWSNAKPLERHRSLRCCYSPTQELAMSRLSMLDQSPWHLKQRPCPANLTRCRPHPPLPPPCPRSLGLEAAYPNKHGSELAHPNKHVHRGEAERLACTHGALARSPNHSPPLPSACS
mmetsp:Transcript_10792/g.26919  ORF Transcript_10792/g.26919 Transcript_10792/m.26919 type:complete len:242 (+) Transcript_10792:639-1364(+)